jgi:hypothetical protein
MSWLDRLAAILPYLPPTLAQTFGLAAVGLVALALCGLGGAVGGRDRLPETDGFVGWGVAVAAFTLVGTLGPVPFTIVAALLLAASIGGFAVRFRRADAVFPAGAAAAILLAAPLVILTLSMTASQWDEFTQWLHSGRYLFEYDLFPGRGRPASGAVYPAYPYALPLIAYLVSRITGQFVENAVALFNLVTLLAVALLFVRLIQVGLDGRRRRLADGAANQPPGWGLIALGLLVATALSPTFVPRLVLSAYAETGTAATVAIAAVLGWAALERAGDGEPAIALHLAARMGLVLAVLVALKEATLALYLLVLGAVALAALRRPDVGWRTIGLVLAAGAAPGLVVYLAWSVYVADALPDQQLHVLPLAQWHWPLLPAILRSMARVALAKSGHFGLMLVLAAVALRALVRPPGQGRGGVESLALIAAAVMVGYNLFLLVTYLAVFPEGEAVHVASFWRYNTHVGLIGMAAAVLGGADLWRRFVLPRLGGMARRALAGVAIALTALGPIGLLAHLRFDIVPGKLFARQVGETLSRTLPIDARLIVVDPLGPGFYPLLVEYALEGHGRVVGAVSALTPDRPAALRRLIREQRATHLLAFAPDPSIEAVTETDPPPGAAALLTREPDGQWRVTKSWPSPPEADRGQTADSGRQK